MELGRLVHANSSREQLRFVDYFDFFDCSLSLSSQYQDNSFVLAMPIDEWKANPIAFGEWVFIPGTEYGGRVQRIRNVAGEKVEVEGYGVRGWMSKWIIQPDLIPDQWQPEGKDYLNINSEDANNAIYMLAMGRLGFDHFNVSDSVSGITVSGQYRHQDVHYAINHLLATEDARMDIAYDDEAVADIEAVAVTDYSRDYDFSQDYGAKLTSDLDRASGYNSIVAYGKGDLSLREKTVWYWVSPSTTQTPPFLDLCDIREYFYDYGSAESLAMLNSEARKQLREVRDKATMSIDLTGIEIELNLGDIVGARDYVTGLVFKDSIYSKILRIENGVTTLNYTMRGDVE